MRQLSLWVIAYGNPHSQPIDRVDVMVFPDGIVTPWLALQIRERVGDEVYYRVWRNSFPDDASETWTQTLAQVAQDTASHRDPRRIWSILRKFLPRRRG